MNTTRLVWAVSLAISLLSASTFAAEKPKKLTCCEKAAVEKKECSNKCCIAAHKAGKSCTKCNPNQEDLKIKKRVRVSP